jgi:hypothetical protein
VHVCAGIVCVLLLAAAWEQITLQMCTSALHIQCAVLWGFVLAVVAVMHEHMCCRITHDQQQQGQLAGMNCMAAVYSLVWRGRGRAAVKLSLAHMRPAVCCIGGCSMVICTGLRLHRNRRLLQQVDS